MLLHAQSADIAQGVDASGNKDEGAGDQVFVVVSVSQATRAKGSRERKRSTTASEILSHTLSGWPSETDSLVNR